MGLLAGCGMLSSLQFTLMIPVLPRVPEMLGTTAPDAAWLITITLLVGVVGTPVITRLADMHGRRRLLLTAMALLVTGSLIAAVIPGFIAVMIGRALQGFGTSVVPIGIALMSTQVSRRLAIFGIAVMSGTLGIGSALGLAVAGPLVAWGGLTTIFWVSAAIGTTFFVLILLRIREVPTSRPGSFDVPGAVLLTVGLAALLLAISRGQLWGWTSPTTLWLFAISAAGLWIWLLWELRRPHPMIDVRIAMSSPILPINLASFVATFGMYANHLLTTQEALAPAATGYGVAAAPAAVGLFLLPSALVMVVLAPLTARVITRHGSRFALLLGASIMTAAFLFRMAVHGQPAAIIAGSALVGTGVSFAFASMPSLITASVPRDQVASANGVNSVVRTLSGAVAAALFALLIATLPASGDSAYLSEPALRIAFATAALCGGATILIAAALRLPHPQEPA